MYREKIRMYTLVQEENQIVYHCTERKSDCLPFYKEKFRLCTIVQRENQIVYHFIRKSEFLPLYRDIVYHFIRRKAECVP